jgi:hypothetical protein
MRSGNNDLDELLKIKEEATSDERKWYAQHMSNIIREINLRKDEFENISYTRTGGIMRGIRSFFGLK